MQILPLKTIICVFVMTGLSVHFSSNYGEDIEPTYRVIEDGGWRDNSAYGVIHRLAGDGTVRGIEAYDVWKEKKNYGKVSMGVVRTTYLIDENGIIIKANDQVKAADDPEKMLGEARGAA